MNKIIPYNSDLKNKANELRNNSTLSEVLLWKYLKGKKLKGHRFIRQKPIDSYIVDFFCKELMLIIEIDGASHWENEEYDRKRDNKLKNLGFNILRFSDLKVKKNIENVVIEIEEWVDGLRF